MEAVLAKDSMFTKEKSPKITFNKKLVMFCLIILTLFLSACYDPIIIDNYCENPLGLSVSAVDPSVLCIPNNFEENPVCLRLESGRDTTHRTINQMYSNLAAHIYFDIASDYFTADDWIDSAAIISDHFFGDGLLGETNCNPEDTANNICDAGDGFFGVGGGPEGGTADSGCVQKLSIPVSTLDYTGTFTGPGGTGSNYGMDDDDDSPFDNDNDNNDIGNILDAGVTTLSAFFYCSQTGVDTRSEGDTSFDLYGDSSDVYSVENKIVTQTFTNGTVSSFICKGGTWLDFPTYILNNPNLDPDGDGAPEGYASEWDCAPNDPTRSPDLSFIGLGKPTEICGDGQVNICTAGDTELYTYLGVLDMVEFDEGSDNCDDNPVACESNCLFEGNECDYLTLPDDPNLPIDQQYYSNQDEGYCCGAGQIDDLGTIKEFNGESACFNKEIIPQGFEEDTCTGGESGDADWCWVDAQTNEKFKIKTVPIVGQTPFDMVSDGQNWHICNETIGEGPLFLSNNAFTGDITTANRFYCFDDGGRWSFAECSGAQETITQNTDPIKIRGAGDGTFFIPIEATNEFYKVFNLGDLGYENTYSNYPVTLPRTINFIGYDYLEFFMRYTGSEIIYPEALNLVIKGLPIDDETQDQVIYFNENVLGYAVNAPILEPERWIHLKVPVGEWVDVDAFIFSSFAERNRFDIKNVYLSRENMQTPICSGKDSSKTDSWLENLDDTNADTYIDGQDICTQYFGPDAWLGYYDEFNEVDEPWATCCGNGNDLGEAEYYTGSTAENTLGARGCWNNQLIFEEDPVMNVEYSVDYSKNVFDLTYPSLGYEYTVNVTMDSSDNPQRSGSLQYSSIPQVVENIVVHLEDNLESMTDTFTVLLDYDEEQYPNVQISLLIPGTQESRNSLVLSYANYPQDFVIQVIAEPNVVHATQYIAPGQFDEFSQPCLTDECVYALPGIPGTQGYTITNMHPELYEMYFVVGSDAEDETLITPENNRFYTQGNLKVTKISQQVIYTQNVDGSYEFLGCNAADYIAIDENIALAANEGICKATSTHYCAPQTNNNLINSWSDEPLTEFGYDVSGYQEGDELQKMDCTNPQNTDVDCTPNARNYSTSATPGRNILSNALFQEKVVNDITFWTLLDSTGHLVSDEYSLIDNEIFEIPSGHILKSEKIAVLPNEDYEFNQESTCDITINVGNNAGSQERGESEIFTTLETESYVQIIIEGECDFTHPSLHLVDDLNVAETEYNNDEPLRTGVSCCPDTMCWNGYTCTQDMAEYTFMSEKIGEVDYRCITGEWTYMGPKKDWKDDEFGFCSNNEQCFVASSLLGALSTNTAADFYDGQYPTCVNNGEYIFDHLCQEGEWISRTTNIVNTFVEFADTKDYVLYCSNYNDVFVDYNEPAYNLEVQIAGQPVAQTTAVLTDPTGQPIEQPTNALCFPNINDPEIGQRLVPNKDNTCINNVCVLKYKDGSDFKTTFATSMNLPLDSPDSFINTLGLTTADLASCTTAGVFSQCTNEVWYSPDIGALIYAKGGINLNPGFFSSVASWFVGLFTGSSASDVSEFLSNATNFNKLYVLNNNADNKQVRAISEPVNGEDVILAEYVGFETPVCEYVLKISEDKVLENRWPASPLYLVTCDGTSNDVYQVMAQTHPEFWWPQLTGALRSFTE